MVDQGGGVHDDVDGLGQALPGVGIQAKVGVADIAGQYFEVLVGQRPEVRQQLRVAGVEGFLQAAVGGLGILTADDGDQLAVCLVQALKPFQGQEPPQVAVGAGEQHRVRGAGECGQCRGRAQGVRVDELVQRQVRGPDLAVPGTVHGFGGGSYRMTVCFPVSFHDACDSGQIVGGADDIANRNLHSEDIAQQVREGKGG
ncbi:Uncharacterised protein [Mycobacteroides abscessus subsp. abscessus]|nr:Uncharacterised protein [Mycobacteroides abscessus subsp. abscessus]SHR37636.1 Uncharacterised protein [Mycobacteroides abscessus subsp. abscessus]SHR44024.1 Uncharacterised protein [Mycobacteroides abscessus subsp. abscessus]SHS68212.1 Uncharacterised protein [Mycobacteroides abscessus subsp. abscessus]SHV03506.1 Uncharacterised protein [Mycobacteroides abscessus subsp. abscessus]